MDKLIKRLEDKYLDLGIEDKIRILLKQGEEVQLECIDEVSFLNSEEPDDEEDDKECILDNRPIIAFYFNFRGDVVLRDHDSIILKDDLKYFRIKESLSFSIDLNNLKFKDIVYLSLKAEEEGYSYTDILGAWVDEGNNSSCSVGRDRMNKLIKRLEDKCLDLGVECER